MSGDANMYDHTGLKQMCLPFVSKNKPALMVCFSTIMMSVLVSSCGGSSSNAPVELSEAQEEMQQLIDGRIRNFKDIGAAFKAVNDEVKAGRFESATVKYSVKSISSITVNMHKWFPEGSGPESGLTTKAKPFIWDNIDDFNKVRSDFEQTIIALLAATEESDAAMIKANFYKAAKGCKTCHELYREKE